MLLNHLHKDLIIEVYFKKLINIRGGWVERKEDERKRVNTRGFKKKKLKGNDS